MIMIKERYNLAFAMRRYAEALSALSDEDMMKMADENFSVEIKFSRRRNKSNIDPGHSKEDVKVLADKLISLETRDDAISFLNENFKTKKSLENIARLLDVSVLKTDKSELLADKIVESTVGARKRSEAIQGYRKPVVFSDAPDSSDKS